MDSQAEKKVAELKVKIGEANAMKNYYQKMVNKYRDLVKQLLAELDDLRDDFWEDDG